MQKTKYSEKLKDPRWQKKRLGILERDGWTCQRCFDSESPLAVHHLRYVPGWEPWDYPEHLLLTLCENCHEYEYQTVKDSLSSLNEQVLDKGFMSDDLRTLANAFNKLTPSKPPEVMATIIEYAFSNPEVMHGIEEMYFKSLKKNKEGKNE